MILIKSNTEIDIMRKNGDDLSCILGLLKRHIEPGMDITKLDEIAEEFIRSQGGVPSFKGYRGFPSSICVSIDCELIHGIPAGQILRSGEIVSIDIGLYKDGYHVDAARTWPVGVISTTKEHLIQSVNRILKEAVEAIRPGIHLGNLSNEIEMSARVRGFEVVRGYGGHGIGKNLHEDPHILNYGDNGTGPILKEGMVLALEPMIMTGNQEVQILDDHWAVVSQDRKPNAHTEDTVVVTHNGCEILTKLRE